MKTPEEIKKGLEACRADECHGHHTGCPYDDDFFCIMHICGDALLTSSPTRWNSSPRRAARIRTALRPRLRHIRLRHPEANPLRIPADLHRWTTKIYRSDRSWRAA